MKTVILAGGRGSRLQEYTNEIPKPMIEIGGQPILYHIMQIYARQGFTDFLIAGGYKIKVIENWLAKADLPWNVNLVDTGEDTLTGGRVGKLARNLSEPFFLTYGDGVSNIDLQKLIGLHTNHQSHITITIVRPPPRFGQVFVYGDYVKEFAEKKQEDIWVNGGFMLAEPEILKYIYGNEALEDGPFTRLATYHLMTAYRHLGFWACMDTLRDVNHLRDLWDEGAPWL